MILLDTHVFIWFVNNDSKLNQNHLKYLEKDENKFISVVSFWEISILLDKDRIKFKQPFQEWILKSINAYEIEIINLDIEIIYVYHKLNDFHSDPADKFIAATSIYKKIPLITFDKKLIEYNGVDTIDLRNTI